MQDSAMPYPSQDLLLHHLANQDREDDAMAMYVLAASEGDEELARLLDDGVVTRKRPSGQLAPARTPVPQTYLGDVHVRAFRGIGPDARLPLKPGPGVTLVVGRNGSGKSSFAEAIEVALTGTCARWDRKGSREWQEGWRSVHAAQPPRIALDVVQQGASTAQVERRWADPSSLATGASHIVRPDGSRTDLAQEGWSAALVSFRPFLSYSELGGLLDEGPSRIYQALLAGLGLEELERVRERLARAATARKKLGEDARKLAAALVARAEQLAAAHPDEPRFAEASKVLRARQPDIDALATLIALPPDDPHGVLVAELTRLEAPAPADVLAGRVAALRALDADLDQARRGAEGRSEQLASLLRTALAIADPTNPAPCPVCGQGLLDSPWAERVRTDLKALDQATSRVRELTEAARAMRQELAPLFTALPSALSLAAAEGWPSAAAAVAAWTAWTSGRALERLSDIASHIESTGPRLESALADIRSEAAAKVVQRDEVWRPFASDAEQWVAQARLAVQAKGVQKQLEIARDWVAGVIDAERSARIEPIKAQAIEFWNTIGRHSNVRLHDILLSGQGKQQRVTLDVTVDDVPAPALGVLSQGELNSMTLSLFLPRILMRDTPFGFVIVDDPVQAMDMSRVDGLATVLASVGETRQVVVFTHDTRLQEAFLRLGLPHVPLEVERDRASEVSIRPGSGPVEQRLSDANAVARANDVPEGLAGQVVPGFCRQALEAACMEPLRRRWLSAGHAHLDVEERLRTTRLPGLLSSLFWDTPERVADVAGRLRRLDVAQAAELVADCQKGAHEGFTGDLQEMVKRTRKLCDVLRKMERAR